MGRTTIAEDVEGGVKVVWGFVDGNWAAPWSIKLALMVLFAILHVSSLCTASFKKRTLHIIGSYPQKMIKECPPQLRTPDCGEAVIDKSAGVLQARANGSVSAVCKSVSLGGKWDRLS